MDSVSKDNGAIESKSWFRAVPVDELIYGMIVRSLAAFRSQAVQYGRLRLFEIGQGKRTLRCLGILGGLLRRLQPGLPSNSILRR
jgi:hypothetical protein